MPLLQATLTHVSNAAATPDDTYPAQLRDITSLEKAAQAFADISQWPGYEASPLRRLDQPAQFQFLPVLAYSKFFTRMNRNVSG